MPLVVVNPDFATGRAIRLPVGSGRLVRFAGPGDRQCVTDQELRSVGGMLKVVGECSPDEVVVTASPGSKPCSPCVEKMLTAKPPDSEPEPTRNHPSEMKCDFAIEHDWIRDVTYRCIRCGKRTPVMKKHEWASARCKRGLGDWIFAITQFFRVPHCGGCDSRRRKLNELHRKWYRRLRGPKNATYLEKQIGEVSKAAAGRS